MSSDPVMSRSGHARRRLSTGIVAGLGVILAVGYGVYTHVERAHAVTATARERDQQVPDVRTMIARASIQPLSLDLPGETVGIETTPIGARASGYIDKRFVDIGTPVQAGQVLAIIRAPELDHRVEQAQATLAQARANLALAQITARRSSGLVGGGAVSKQNFDVDRLTQNARQAEQKAADAVLAETAQRQAYTTVTAPYDGVVTVRNVEAGDLVSADSTARPLFVVTRTDRLRVRVHVPQDAALTLKVGEPASMSVPERPGQIFKGTVTRTGHALEQDSRMLPVEIDIDNHDNRLTAGLYAEIHFDLPRAAPVIMVPSEALNYEADGLSVETVEADNKITVRKVKIGRDYGDHLEILNGLPDGSQLVVHPPSALHEGSVVAPQLDKSLKVL
ncbi:efflux RND transporter periplasmic adaptor subunit [Acetobacter senegalensis]|uniref:efflux RND transporter periplasmic adaptor subunit n=1 Tax=Acetobacter senegalensis TaxID=446692 RepID=UPI00264D977E|nr:efflux RND transporter periplasmic adaptor subunit [Acetobacter senegalensis]MDN7356238.1 efflux RND transporter periplasmic adaptor subunit [Acetobacter senegalensis]